MGQANQQMQRSSMIAWMKILRSMKKIRNPI